MGPAAPGLTAIPAKVSGMRGKPPWVPQCSPPPLARYCRLALIGAAWDRIAQVTSALIPDPVNHEVESKIIVLGCKEGLVCHTEIYTLEQQPGPSCQSVP